MSNLLSLQSSHITRSDGVLANHRTAKESAGPNQVLRGAEEITGGTTGGHSDVQQPVAESGGGGNATGVGESIELRSILDV